MSLIDPIYVGPDALAQFVRFSGDRGLKRFALVADRSTYTALGERVEQTLAASGCQVTRIVLEGREVIADEPYLVQTLIRAPLGECVFLAVGSGTLTDITRFVSHRSGRAFIALPSAPSVDGFTSIGAPLVLNGVKQTINCQAPVALFADLDTLCAAPQPLIAAGFGDMLGKYTSLADWKLGALLWDEPFDAAIYARSQAAVAACVSRAQTIGQRSEDGVRHLIEALIESGLCMLDFGSSRPASGAEHHASHYWEMKLLQERRPAILHGAKVGYALLHVAELYARLRSVSRAELLDRLESAALPDRESELAIIQQGYGALADDVIAEHRAFLDLTPEGFEQIKTRIAAHWDEIQTVAASVPGPDTLAGYLQQAGAATTGEALGLGADEIAPGFQYGHYLRNRFTVLKLSRVLSMALD